MARAGPGLAGLGAAAAGGAVRGPGAGPCPGDGEDDGIPAPGPGPAAPQLPRRRGARGRRLPPGGRAGGVPQKVPSEGS